MMKKNKFFCGFIVIVILVICVSSIYKNFFEPIKVIPGTQCVNTMYKGFGYAVTSLQNEDTDIEIGDIIISIDKETIYDYSDVNEVISRHQNTNQENIKISYIRDESLYETYIDKGVELGATAYQYNWVSKSYVSMVDPKTYRYAIDPKTPYNYELSNLFSGVIMEINLQYKNQEIYTSSTGNVIGSVTDAGEKCVYGYMEPYSYEEEKLVEVARKHQVKDGKAIIELKCMDEDYRKVAVELDCHEKGINITLSEDSSFDSFTSFDISGLPVYQDGKLVGVYMLCSDDKHGYAWYAIDVYNEMMEKAK